MCLQEEEELPARLTAPEHQHHGVVNKITGTFHTVSSRSVVGVSPLLRPPRLVPLGPLGPVAGRKLCFHVSFISSTLLGGFAVQLQRMKKMWALERTSTCPQRR